MGWKATYGYQGCRVIVRELAGGWMQGDIRAKGYPRKRIRLGHQDRNAAKRWAKQTQADLQKGVTQILESQPTLERICGLYLKYQTPKKRNATSRQHDQRCADMWLAVLGSQKTPEKITTQEWEDFVAKRRSGERDARWAYVPLRSKEKPRRAVRDRAIERDMDWLVQTLNWAVRFRDTNGRYLLTDNPLRGFDIPSELNPRRPIVTRDWMEQVINAAGRSPLRTMLVIADEHGRRLSAIRQLQGSDIQLGRTNAWPHGAIRWRYQQAQQGLARTDERATPQRNRSPARR